MIKFLFSETLKSVSIFKSRRQLLVVKNFLLFLIFAVLFTGSISCKRCFQIATVKADNVAMKNNGNYSYEDDVMCINYNFWNNTDGANVGFTITNKTDELIFVDLTKTFLIFNGYANDYFKNRQYSGSIGLSEAYTVGNYNVGYGIYSSFDIMGSLRRQVESYSKSMSMLEKHIIIIPAHTRKTFAEYTICKTPYESCDLNSKFMSYSMSGKAQKSKGNSLSFNSVTSPYNFSNLITYRLGNSEKEYQVENKFYVNSITNFLRRDVIEKVVTKDCNNKDVKEKRNRYQSKESFYSTYIDGVH